MKARRTDGDNMHYAPQISFCDLLPLADFDFYGHLNGNPNDVYSQAKQMFEETARVPKDHPTFWKALEMRFPTTHVDDGHWVDHNTHASKKAKDFFRSPDTYELVTNAYDMDYTGLALKRGHYEYS